MILISHRGNISGENPEKENHPEYIDKAISLGYDVEIDVWDDSGKIVLGHDVPQYEIDMNLHLAQGTTDITRVDTRLLLYPYASVFAGSVIKVSTATDMTNFTANNTAHIEITDPLNEYFEIQAKAAFTPNSPYFQIDFTRVFIKKIACVPHGI